MGIADGEDVGEEEGNVLGALLGFCKIVQLNICMLENIFEKNPSTAYIRA